MTDSWLMVEYGEACGVADEAIERSRDGARPRVVGHPRGKRRDFSLRCRAQFREAIGVQAVPSRLHQLAIDRVEPGEKLRSSLAPCLYCRSAQPIELTHGGVDSRIKGG